MHSGGFETGTENEWNYRSFSVPDFFAHLAFHINFSDNAFMDGWVTHGELLISLFGLSPYSLKENSSMSNHEHQSGCACCSLSRRQFVAAGAVAAGAVAVSPNKPVFAQANGKKLKIRVFFSLHADVQVAPDWPNVGFDFRPVMEDYMAGFKKVLPDVEFVSSMANGPDQTKAILEEDGDSVHGYIDRKSVV